MSFLAYFLVYEIYGYVFTGVALQLLVMESWYSFRQEEVVMTSRPVGQEEHYVLAISTSIVKPLCFCAERLIKRLPLYHDEGYRSQFYILT